VQEKRRQQDTGPARPACRVSSIATVHGYDGAKLPWSFGKLVMMAWEECLRGSRGKQEKKPWERFHWTDSVEHIYPQTPNEHWQQAIITKGRNNDRASAAIAGSLGNLLLSGPLNAVNSNHAYQAVGNTQGKRSRYASGSYSEIHVSTLCERWTVVEIAARGIAMLQNAQHRWGFELLPADAKEVDWLSYLFGLPVWPVLRSRDFRSFHQERKSRRWAKPESAGGTLHHLHMIPR